MIDNNDKKLRRIELYTSTALQVGVTLSAVFIITGVILFLINHKQTTSYHIFVNPGYLFPHSFSALVKSLKSGQGIGFIVLGSLLLILTPISRVATSILLFIYQKDKPMSLVTLFVLIVLISSFFVGIAVK